MATIEQAIAAFQKSDHVDSVRDWNGRRFYVNVVNSRQGGNLARNIKIYIDVRSAQIVIDGDKGGATDWFRTAVSELGDLAESLGSTIQRYGLELIVQLDK